MSRIGLTPTPPHLRLPVFTRAVHPTLLLGVGQVAEAGHPTPGVGIETPGFTGDGEMYVAGPISVRFGFDGDVDIRGRHLGTITGTDECHP